MVRFLSVVYEKMKVITTYNRRVNNKLDAQSVPHIENLGEDIANGVRLIQLLVGDKAL